MRQWLISKIPTWVLRLLIKRNYRLRGAVLLSDEWYWADLVLAGRDRYVCIDCYHIAEHGEGCFYCRPLGPSKPFGVPSWLGDKHDPYGIGEDEK